MDLLHAIPWALTIFGIFLSLGWNLFNYTRTTAIQRDLRLQQIKLEEFRRLRDRIDEALAALMGIKKSLISKSAQCKRLTQLKSGTLAIERDMSACYVELQDSLIAADESAYASGSDWLTNVEARWEVYADHMFEFREQATLPAAKGKIDEAVGALADISRVLSNRLDQEIGIYARSPGRSWFEKS